MVKEDVKKNLLIIVQQSFKTQRVTSRYQKGAKLTGALYLHPITDDRITRSAVNSRDMCKKLCGDNVPTILVTTMWSEFGDDQETGTKKQNELERALWSGMMGTKAQSDRLKSLNSREAWRVVDTFISECNEEKAQVLRKELEELEDKLSQTPAGKKLYEELQGFLTNEMEKLKGLAMERAKEKDDGSVEAERQLWEEYEKIRGKLEDTITNIERLKVRVKDELKAFFVGKALRAVSFH